MKRLCPHCIKMKEARGFFNHEQACAKKHRDSDIHVKPHEEHNGDRSIETLMATIKDTEELLNDLRQELSGRLEALGLEFKPLQKEAGQS